MCFVTDVGRAQVLNSSTQVVPFAAPWDVTFRHLDHAQRRLDVDLTRDRRALDRSGPSEKWIGVRESLLHRGSHGEAEQVRLQLLEVLDRELSSSELALRSALHSSQANSIYSFHGFRIHDVEAALANYWLVWLGSTKVSERDAYHMAAIPRNPGHSLWLLAVDVETAYPLYSGEFNPSGALVSETIVRSFRHGRQVQFPEQPWWITTPANVRRFDSPADAYQTLNGQYVLPETSAIASEWSPMEGLVQIDALSGGRRLVMTFTDGIDFLSVIESPVADTTRKSMHSIGIYSEEGITQCSFQDCGLEVLVIGRGAADSVRSAAASVYRQLIGR